MTVGEALERYLREVSVTKSAHTQPAHFGSYGLAIRTPALVACYPMIVSLEA